MKRWIAAAIREEVKSFFNPRVRRTDSSRGVRRVVALVKAAEDWDAVAEVMGNDDVGVALVYQEIQRAVSRIVESE